MKAVRVLLALGTLVLLLVPMATSTGDQVASVSAGSRDEISSRTNAVIKLPLQRTSNHTTSIHGDNALCSAIESAIQDLPGSCKVTAGCLGFSCTFTLFSVIIEYHVIMQFCSRPIGFEIGIKVPSIPGIDYEKQVYQLNYTKTPLSIDEPIPLLKLTVPATGGAAKAEGYFQASVSLSAWEISMSIGIDVCAVVAGYKVCGSKLTPDMPLSIFKLDENLLGPCKSNPPSGKPWDPHAKPGTPWCPSFPLGPDSYYGTAFKQGGCGEHLQAALTNRAGSVYENAWCRPTLGCNIAERRFCPQPLVEADLQAGCWSIPPSYNPQTAINQCGLRCKTDEACKQALGNESYCLQSRTGGPINPPNGIISDIGHAGQYCSFYKFGPRRVSHQEYDDNRYIGWGESPINSNNSCQPGETYIQVQSTIATAPGPMALCAPVCDGTDGSCPGDITDDITGNTPIGRCMFVNEANPATTASYGYHCFIESTLKRTRKCPPLSAFTGSLVMNQWSPALNWKRLEVMGGEEQSYLSAAGDGSMEFSRTARINMSQSNGSTPCLYSYPGVPEAPIPNPRDGALRTKKYPTPNDDHPDKTTDVSVGRCQNVPARWEQSNSSIFGSVYTSDDEAVGYLIEFNAFHKGDSAGSICTVGCNQAKDGGGQGGCPLDTMTCLKSTNYAYTDFLDYDSSDDLPPPTKPWDPPETWPNANGVCVPLCKQDSDCASGMKCRAVDADTFTPARANTAVCLHQYSNPYLFPCPPGSDQLNVGGVTLCAPKCQADFPLNTGQQWPDGAGGVCRGYFMYGKRIQFVDVWQRWPAGSAGRGWPKLPGGFGPKRNCQKKKLSGDLKNGSKNNGSNVTGCGAKDFVWNAETACVLSADGAERHGADGTEVHATHCAIPCVTAYQNSDDIGERPLYACPLGMTCVLVGEGIPVDGVPRNRGYCVPEGKALHPPTPPEPPWGTPPAPGHTDWHIIIPIVLSALLIVIIAGVVFHKKRRDKKKNDLNWDPSFDATAPLLGDQATARDVAIQ